LSGNHHKKETTSGKEEGSTNFCHISCHEQQMHCHDEFAMY